MSNPSKVQEAITRVTGTTQKVDWVKPGVYGFSIVGQAWCWLNTYNLVEAAAQNGCPIRWLNACDVEETPYDSPSIRQLIEDGIDPDEIVSEGYTWRQLHRAFDMVCNKDNWKLSIKAIIPEREQWAVDASINFFVGGGAHFEPVAGKQLKVTALGYYLTIGA